MLHSYFLTPQPACTLCIVVEAIVAVTGCHCCCSLVLVISAVVVAIVLLLLLSSHGDYFFLVAVILVASVGVFLLVVTVRSSGRWSG
jgi:hypothetical protein